ncbi:hypothetical protein [Nocardioides sp. AE5]|uniref:hypothetical protein n=1 Tax=Nocardioides sp. AE5 TaxID=2962573 RepID=UPI002881AFF7|nr:hypothetical protein [Nocardioides sp. AE5]MDT0202255.1 hypothetical protein [Nocardioides sp. AE5]
MDHALLFALRAEEEAPPEAKDVVAGGWGLALFIGLIVVVALLLWSFARHIRKARLAAEAGVFGEDTRTAARDADTTDADTTDADTTGDDTSGDDATPTGTGTTSS